MSMVIAHLEMRLKHSLLSGFFLQYHVFTLIKYIVYVCKITNQDLCLKNHRESLRDGFLLIQMKTGS